MQQHLPFTKYQGTGNDFIIIDEEVLTLPLSHKQIQHLCDRRFGIGADGLMLFKTHSNYDFEMLYYNSDGHESTMCGNGGRCIAHYASQKLNKKELLFLAIDGEHKAIALSEGQIALQMAQPSIIEKQIAFDAYTINTGSPHFVKFVEHIEEVKVYEEGKQIRYHKQFQPKGLNVNFVQVQDQNTLKVYTYERGVEDETFSCGTGVVASALVARQYNKISQQLPIQIQTKGGFLQVDVKEDQVWLEGAAQCVFLGFIPFEVIHY